jgi:polysaccharide pyruvyl transferase WcaK-like protein
MNILLIGANFSNKGAEAMMLTVKQEMEKRYDSTKIFMLCRGYEKELAEKLGIIPVFSKSGAFEKKMKSIRHRVKGKLYKILFKKEVPYVFKFPFAQIRKYARDVDLVIDISGFAYADSWGVPVISETIKLQRVLKKKGIKFYFLPQAWGSFDKPEVARAMTEMLSMANKFYARDLVSQKYLSDLLHKKADNVPLMHDLVFGFENSHPGKNVLGNMGFNPDKNKLLIGISPNLRVYEKAAGFGEKNEYLILLLSLANYCINELNANVVFIPNELFPPTMQVKDDRFLSGLLAKLVDNPEKCFAVEQYCSAEEIYDIVSTVDLLAGSRFHALIFGFLNLKPVMAISWSHKYRELFRLFELEDFVLESGEMNAKSAIDVLKKLVAERESIKEKIESRLPVLRRKSRELFDEIRP